MANYPFYVLLRSRLAVISDSLFMVIEPKKSLLSNATPFESNIFKLNPLLIG